MNPPWMLVRLALETSVHHGAADDDRLAALSITSTPAYRAFLVRVFGFESIVEETVMRFAELDLHFVRDHARSHQLRRDLMLLGMSEREIGICPRASIAIRTPGEALGWMFVLERHTLVAGLLCRQIQQVVGSDVPIAYLGAGGPTPGARFRRFGEKLGDLAQTYRPALIVDGAANAFRAQRQWYRTKDPAELPRSGTSEIKRATA